MILSCRIPVGRCVATVVLVAGIAFAANPSTKKEARVTQIVRDVKLLPAGADPRSAVQDDRVPEDTGVRTGDESRSELTFEDLTITRLGANTIFSFNNAGRKAQLDSGSILLHVPKNSGGAEFRTRAITVGITGTTLIFESTRLGNSKLIVLEGEARLRLIKYSRQSRNVRAGQQLEVKPGAVKLPEPVDVDLEQIMKTHSLITDFPPLPSQDLILAAIKDQQKPTAGGSPVSQGRPGAPSIPANAFTPAPVPNVTPPFGPTSSPRAKRTPAPSGQPTFTPQKTPPPRPKRSPRINPTVNPGTTPKQTPAPSPRIKRPPKSGPGATPAKKIRGPTPTPSPGIR